MASDEQIDMSPMPLRVVHDGQLVPGAFAHPPHHLIDLILHEVFDEHVATISLRARAIVGGGVQDTAI